MSCSSKYQYDEQRFEGKPSKKIRCAKCQHIFEIFNPAFAAKASPAKGSAAGESTNMKREPKPPPPQETTAEAPVPQAESGNPPSTQLQMPTGRRLSLAIIDGPGSGNVFRIEKPRVTIGRSGADLNLNDSEASRQHAAVEVRDSLYTLVDLGSTNGTLFEGQRVAGTAELQNHAEFVVGGTTLMLIVTEE
ncbi:MAG TPA: FHA domain-containing protein [Thermoanaerobaculia bacterium]|nr:FHA domain-containing protein [Thermoanaerobaculia bacterium]